MNDFINMIFLIIIIIIFCSFFNDISYEKIIDSIKEYDQ